MAAKNCYRMRLFTGLHFPYLPLTPSLRLARKRLRGRGLTARATVAAVPLRSVFALERFRLQKEREMRSIATRRDRTSAFKINPRGGEAEHG
jgi:hypothetical protein